MLMASTQSYSTRITGTGSAFPKTRWTNQMIAEKMAGYGFETTDEWIRERTGIAERRFSTPGDDNECNSALGCQAAKLALEMAGKVPEDIDQIIYATVSPDQLLVSSACHLQSRLGAKNAWAIDINAACSGFIYAMALADQAIRSGHSKTILVVGADLGTYLINWKERGSCILFGDGAGAVIIERAESDSASQVLSYHLQTDGSLHELLYVPVGGSRLHVTHELMDQNLHKLTMRGKEIFKMATRFMTDYAYKALDTGHISLDELNWFIPHQANLRIIEAVLRRMNFPREKTILNIENYGNTTAATIPTAMDEAIRDGRIQRGHTLLFASFGAGLSYGSMLLRW